MIRLLHFIFPARLKRLNYLIRLLLSLGLSFLIFSPQELETLINDPKMLELSKVKTLALTFTSLYQAVYIAIPRIKDAGLRSWLVLLMFLPFVSALFACFLTLMPTRWPADDSTENKPLE